MANPPTRSSSRTKSIALAPWWCIALSTLGQRDPRLAAIIGQLGGHALESRGEAFTTLARAVVGQQISVKAADTIWLRLLATCDGGHSPRLSPSSLLRVPEERLRAAGLSQSKTRYLLDLAGWFQANPRLSQRLASADDSMVKAMLVERPGIGPWTADMFLIFTLMRPDVFPVGDLGVLKAMGLLYFEGQTPSRSQAIAHAERWRPYRTAASWLLWRSLDPIPVQY